MKNIILILLAATLTMGLSSCEKEVIETNTPVNTVNTGDCLCGRIIEKAPYVVPSFDSQTGQQLTFPQFWFNVENNCSYNMTQISFGSFQGYPVNDGYYSYSVGSTICKDDLGWIANTSW